MIFLSFIVKGHVTDQKVGDTVEMNNGKVTKSGNNSSIQPLYKNGENGGQSHKHWKK